MNEVGEEKKNPIKSGGDNSNGQEGRESGKEEETIMEQEPKRKA